MSQTASPFVQFVHIKAFPPQPIVPPRGPLSATPLATIPPSPYSAMSVACAPMTISLAPFEVERKRTASFSLPRHAKSPRTSSLQRTHSFLELPISLADLPSMELYGRSGAPRPSVSEAHPRSLKRRESRTYSHSSDLSAFVASTARLAPMVHSPQPIRSFVPPTPPLPSCIIVATPSPVAPKPKSTKRSPKRFLPPRERYPSSRPEPDLYRQALVARMRASPEGAQILRMGAHAAVTMLNATRELEALVAGVDDDFDMDLDDESHDEPKLGDSWLVLPREDWETVEQQRTAV